MKLGIKTYQNLEKYLCKRESETCVNRRRVRRVRQSGGPCVDRCLVLCNGLRYRHVSRLVGVHDLQSDLTRETNLNPLCLPISRGFDRDSLECVTCLLEREYAWLEYELGNTKESAM